MSYLRKDRRKRRECNRYKKKYAAIMW